MDIIYVPVENKGTTNSVIINQFDFCLNLKKEQVLCLCQYSNFLSLEVILFAIAY